MRQTEHDRVVLVIEVVACGRPKPSAALLHEFRQLRHDFDTTSAHQSITQPHPLDAAEVKLTLIANYMYL